MNRALDTAISLLQEAARKDPENVNIRVNLILGWIKRKQPEKVVNEFKSIVQLRPDWVQFHYDVIDSLAKQGYFNIMQIAFQKASQYEPKNAIIYYGLGIIFQIQNEQDKAIQVYRKAVEIQPTFASAYHNLGIAYYIKGKLDAAIAAYKEAIGKCPKIAEPHFALGVIYLRKKEARKALEYFEKFISLAPPYLSTFISYAKLSILTLAGK